MPLIEEAKFAVPEEKWSKTLLTLKVFGRALSSTHSSLLGRELKRGVLCDRGDDGSIGGRRDNGGGGGGNAGGRGGNGGGLAEAEATKHHGSEQPRIKTEVLGHLLVCWPTPHCLLPLRAPLRTFVSLFTHSLTPKLVGKILIK